MSPKARLPVVFLGCAHPHADGRANRIRNVEGTTLAGAFDDDDAVLAGFGKRHSAQLFTTPAAALGAAKGGLAIVETWNKRAAEFARLAIDAGVPVLLEKPGAHQPKALRELAARAKARKAWVQVGYHMRYAPSVEPALELVRAGRLGKVTTGRFHASVQKPWLLNDWFCDEDDLGGLVFLDFCHVLDLLLLLLGGSAPSEVVCRTKKLPELGEHPFEDSAALLLTIDDALIAGDVCGWETNDWVDTWDVQLFGTEGTLCVSPHPPRVRFWSPKDGAADESAKKGKGSKSGNGWSARSAARGWTELRHESFNGEENYERELRDVVTRLQKGKEPGGCKLEQAVVIVDAIEKAYESANGKAARKARE